MASSSNSNAPAKSWNYSRVTIVCPYCKNTHGHGIPGDDGQTKYNNIQRASDCSGGDYTVVFPFDVERDLVGYEINKEERTFVPAKFQGGQANGAITRLEVARQERPQFSSASTNPYAVEIKGKEYAHHSRRRTVMDIVSECIYGNIDVVEAFLNEVHGTDDFTIFLHGEDECGNTALYFAAIEKIPGMVELLLRYGSDVNAQNKKGRTPLMEAALWGRPENVRILLEHNADKTLQDRSGKLAIDLAQTSRVNEEERYHRAKTYTEVAFEARRNREHIIQMLETPLTKDQMFGFGAPDNQNFHDNEFALLDRGDPFPLIHATSREIGGAHDIVVGGRSLRQLVIEIAELVGHQQCSASHASKQLIAYFIDKHVFLPGDIVDENKVNDMVVRRESYGYEVDDEEERRLDLTLLKRAQPPVCLKRAKIRSSTAACPDCEEFCRRVNTHFDLKLVLQAPVNDWFISREGVKIGKAFARGSFGTVHIGELHGTEVVVKCAKIDGQSESDKQKRREVFLNEVRVWQRVHHPHIVQFLGAYHDCFSWFIVSEHASGGTLKKYLNNHRNIGRALVWRMLHKVALGLYSLHEQKIVHSDIKSDNILMSKEGEPMLSDFGLSFEVSESRPKLSWAAIQYRPPEYVMENATGPSFAGDVYSLGMCIIEAVTGQPPWGSLSDTVVRFRLREKEMPSRPREMSGSEWELVESMCAFEPSARMQLVDVIKRLQDLAKEEQECGTQAPISTLSLSGHEQDSAMKGWSETASTA